MQFHSVIMETDHKILVFFLLPYLLTSQLCSLTGLLQSADASHIQVIFTNVFMSDFCPQLGE